MSRTRQNLPLRGWRARMHYTAYREEAGQWLSGKKEPKASWTLAPILVERARPLRVPHFPTMCPASFSFSVQTYSPMSSLASSSDALVIFHGFA